MSDSDTTLDEPVDEVSRAELEQGLAAIAPDAVPMLPGEVLPHPTPFQYVMVAVVLCAITALEVGTFYLEGEIPDALLVSMLLVMAFSKFVLVASWYMHLRTDRPIFRRFFIVGGSGAIVLYLIVLATLHVFD